MSSRGRVALKKRIVAKLAVIGAWGLGGFVVGCHHDEGDKAATFAALRTAWAHNIHEKAIDASVAEYAPDAEFMGTTGSRVSGSDALHQLFQTVTTTYDADMTFDSKRVEVAGDMAYDSGSYAETLSVRADGRVLHSNGSYLTVYRRGKDGTWLIEQQIWAGKIE